MSSSETFLSASAEIADTPLPPSACSESAMASVELIKKARVGMIDDEVMNIDVVQGYLEQSGYRNFFRTTESKKGIALIKSTKPDVVLLDIMMPVVSGLEILAQMRANAELSHIPVIILTACTDGQVKRQALELGATDFLAKPIDPSELLPRLRNVVEAKAYQDQLKNYSRNLRMEVERRTQEVIESRQRIIHCLARAAEFRDDDTGHHVTRVGQYVAVIAKAMGYNDHQADLLGQAAQLHDVGKIGVPDAVLSKAGPLDGDEVDIIRKHCDYGTSIIEPLGSTERNAYRRHAELGEQLLEYDGFPVMELAGVIAKTHHEKWDGSGYPNGLAGEDIPIEGRITAVADVYDALSSKRAYKPAFPPTKCFKVLAEGAGTHFDPRVLRAFFSATDEIQAVQERYSDA